MIINPYLVQPSGPSYGTLTTAWIAATGETDTTILGALNTLETDLTTYGLTSKMNALYPFVGGTAGKHSYNFMNTTLYQITWYGGYTHSSTGILPNGTNAYGDTNLTPSSVMNLNSSHISFYSRTNNDGVKVDLGCTDATTSDMIDIRESNLTYMRINGGNMSYANSDSFGFYLVNRTSSTNVNSWKNGVKKINSSIAAQGLSTVKRSISAYNNGSSRLYFSNREGAFVTMGDGLTDAEAANLYIAVQAFQTALSRQV